MNFDQKLKEKLKQNIEFWDEEIDDINRNEIIDRAYKVDKDLIGILIDDKEIRETFFDKIKEYWVFNINKFVDYIENIKVLSNSYTKFKNIVGLNVNGKYLNERGEVSLVWPFKDCVLEGGMTKEDQKRNEIFFNEILAKDEIDRLFDAKVLTNFKKYTAKGEEKVKDFNRDKKGTIKDNLIIKGNNLLALHSLKKEFAGKVKLIYIDVPFNTELDSFSYNDNFTHSTWLTFMKNRLEVAKELLEDNGTIFVHLDWHESHYCKLLLDQIFGRNKLINEIIWCYAGPGSPLMKQFNRKHDTIFWYRKGEEWTFNKDEIRVPYKDPNQSPRKAFGEDWTDEDVKEMRERGKVPEDWWEFSVAARLRVDGKKRTGYLTEKPLKLMKRIVKSASNEGDIILDFFAGAGTTGYVANELKRQFILVEQLEDTQKKLKKRFEETNYIYCELLKYNEDAIDKIQDAKDTKTLLKIWDEMCEHYFLNYDVKIKKFNENKKDFEKLTLKQQKDTLVEMLNKNQLYVNLSEIEDSQFKVSKEDKELNKKFYGGK
ncbi:MAG: DNA methyltransferase [archaeon]